MRQVPIQPKPPADYRSEPGWREWTAPIWGRCSNCGQPGRLERHHVYAAQHCRAEGVPIYDLRNSMPLGRYCRCHRDHTSAATRIPRSKLPPEAIEFLRELLGDDHAEDYLARFYR